MRTLTIDIGGTGIKLLLVDEKGEQLADRHRELTPKPSTPEAVLQAIKDMVSTKPRPLPIDPVHLHWPTTAHGPRFSQAQDCRPRLPRG